MNDIKQLKKIKLERRLSYEEMGHEIGVTSRTLFRWMRGTNQPSRMGRMLIKKYVSLSEKKNA